MKKIAIILSLLNTLFLLVVLAACENFSFSETHEGKVVKVLDGDSLNIIQQGKEVRIRLAEIDAPEHGQFFWKQSRQALESYVSDKNVSVEEFDRDQYGRIVGHVYLNDTWINGKLVQQGYAYVYDRYAVSKKLHEYQAQAEKNKVGIWKLPEKQRVKPWDWRKTNLK
ncbi:MAG: thermonuclease family protein [Gammaproteobacteria bacterium]|nr:thermonuclease family protein [Gammaproteobacteria bacterium]